MTSFDEAVDLLIATCEGQKYRSDSFVEIARENLEKAEAERDAAHTNADTDIKLLDEIRETYYDADLIYTEFLLGSLGKRGEFLSRYIHPAQD